MTQTMDPTDEIKDRGWAWVIALACLVGNFFVIGFTKSFGLFFVEFLELFDASSSATSLIFGTQGVAFSISSLFVMTVLVERLTCRSLVIIGSVLFGVGVILASQAVTLTEAVIYIGVFTGVANSFLTGPFMLILGKYFKRRHALACGIAVCGGSLGQFLLPPLLRLLIDIYAFRGAVLIFGGLVLNCAVCGALMRPVPDQRSKHKRSKLLREIKQIRMEDSDVNCENESMLESGTAAENYFRNIPLTENVLPKLTIRHIEGSQIAQNDNSFDSTPESPTNHPCWTEEQYLQLMTEDPPLHLSSGNLFTSPAIFTGSQNIKHAGNKALSDWDRKPRMVSVCRCCNALAYYCSLLRNPLFLLTLLAMVLGYVGVVTQVVFIPPHAKDVGLSSEKIPLLISIMGGFDLAGRIFIGLITDTKVIASYHILSFGFIALGITALLTFLATTFWGFVAVSVSYGIAGGIMYSIVPVVVIDFFGLETLPRALGVIYLFQGSALCSANPLLGWLRDITGSYVTSFYVIGGFLVIAGISLLLVPLFRHGLVVKHESIIVPEKDSVKQDLP